MEDDMDTGYPRKKLGFEEKKREFVRFLESNDNAVMVLATSCDDHVCARNVLIANDGIDLYFFTWRHSRKCAQILKNPRVALCKDDMKIEGVAEILGDLINEKTKKYADIMRDKFPDAIKQWEQRPGMIILRVRPTFASFGGSDDPPCLEFLDLINREAYSERWAYY
jgi:general stress protein 26